MIEIAAATKRPELVGGLHFFNPVPVLKLVDGHHRYLAAAEMDVPVRAFIATVDAEHGDWESMHDYQKDDGDGAERGSKAGLHRRMAAWNRLAGAR